MCADNVNLNLNKGKLGQADLNKIKGGLKREQIKDKALLAIFDALDDGNHVLDEKEISKLKTSLQEAAKNSNLSKNEAEKFLKKLFGDKKDKNVTNDDLFKFINALSNNSKNIQNSTATKENGQQVITTEYKDGSVEKIYPDTNKKIIIKDNKTSTYSMDNTIQKEEYFDQNGNAVTTTFTDGKPQKKTVKTQTETLYYEISDKGEKLVKRENTQNKATTDYEYDEKEGTVNETEQNGNVTTKRVRRNGKVESQTSVEKLEDSTVETVTDANGNVTKTTVNSAGKRIKQEKTIDGKTYVAEYDGNGNTKVIVQNGESIAHLAKIFKIKQGDIIEVNEPNGKVHRKGTTKFFRVGDTVLIPKELEADDKNLTNRKSSADAIADYKEAMAEIRKKQQERSARAKEKAQEAKAHEAEQKRKASTPRAISFTCKQKNFTEVAKQNLASQGVKNPTKKQLEDKIAQIKKLNPNLKDGQIQGKRITVPCSEEIYNRVVRREKEVTEINRNMRNNKTAKGIANNLYKICDDNAAAINKPEFWNEMKKVNKNNIVAVLDNYDKVIEKHSGDSSLLDTICSEVGASATNRQKALNHIYNSLEQAAKEAGVSQADLKNARKKFSTSMQHEFDKIGRIDTKEMDKVVDFLRGATAAAKVTKGQSSISTRAAMKSFLNGEDGLVALDKDVQKQYKDARDKEGWVAKTGDWVCGLFGCTTIADMDKKLGKHSADVKKLVAAANKNDEATFKKLYKQTFGIDFNPKMIQARQTARANYESAAAFNASYKAFAGLESKAKNMDYQSLRNELKKSFKYSDSDIDTLIKSYAQSRGMDSNSQADKKYILDSFIKESKQQYLKEFQKLSKGKTLEQMGKDVDLLTKSAYGTNDIVKDVIKFNENQQMTEMVTSAAFEIAGTIALQFVPGLGQMAAAKLAVSAAKWGARGVKIATYAAKASKALKTVSTAMNATKKAKIITQMATAGVATATVNLSNKKDVKETMRKTLMNMSFAGVGASSSILAPKLMQAFGITNKALATEVAEEIINCAGSYGVTKLAGDDYGKNDAFIDFASGLLMSRISHVKMHKGTKVDTPTPKPEIDPSSPKPEIETEHQGAIKPETDTKPSVEDGSKKVPDDLKKPSDKPIDDNDLKNKGKTITTEEADKFKEAGTSTKPPVSDGKPSLQHPQEKNFNGLNGEDLKFEVVSETDFPKGKKSYLTKDDKKIFVDADGKIISIKDYNAGTIKAFDYHNAGDVPSGYTLVNKKQQIIRQVESKVDTNVTKNYETGIETITSAKDGSVITERYMSLSEYPANAKIPDAAKFSENLKAQIEECTDINKLNKLKDEYNMYNSQYGSADGSLFQALQDKASALKGTAKPTPHKPLSNLVTSTALDNALENLNMKKYGKKGLPLKYSHDEMLKDLKESLMALPYSERSAIMNKFNIHTIGDELSDIPKLSQIPSTPNEEKILNILNKYAKQNSLQISDPALKAELENFIKDVPEFTFMIGKKQNGIHAYSLDSHTIQNLQKALKYAADANISDEQKEILKMSILLHDMGKQYKGVSVSDTGHAALSKQYAASILDRFNYSTETKNKILNLIENHHWFKDFNKGNITADQVVKMFGDDLTLAQIMAKADLESVSDTFHLEILEPGKKLSQAEFNAKFQEKMDKISGKITPDVLGEELPIGQMKKYQQYYLDKNKIDKLILGQGVELDMNDPKLKQLMNDLKEGESFAIGCTDPHGNYPDVKYQIGKYADGVGSHHVIITKKHGEFVIEVHKDAAVMKDIPTAHNSDPIIAKKIEQIKKKATHITSETFTINGKNVPFEILHGTQGGSNKGYYVINKQTGELFYAKFGGAQGKTELLANKLYEMAGLGTPEMSSFKAPDGTVGTLSKYMPDLTSVTQATSKANDGFGMDVLLANWDVVGMNNDNMLKTADGKIIRLDAGGTFDYRAQGKNKPYTSIPMEFVTLMDSNINSKSAQIFAKMTRDDLINSLNKVANLKTTEITNLLDSMGLSHYKEPLLNRKKFLKSLLEEIKANPQGSESTLEYMHKMMNKSLDNAISSAKSATELQDIKQALTYVNNPKTKQQLLDNIAIKEKAIAASAPTPKFLSEVQVGNFLAKHGFVKDYNGNYTRLLSSTEKANIVSQYGTAQASKVIAKLEKPLNANDIKNLQTMINESSSFINLNQIDQTRLVLLYQSIIQGSSGVFNGKMTPAKWAMIMNIAQAQPITATQLAAFDDYKGNSGPINGGLTTLKKGGTISPTTQKQIDAIQSYINTQTLPETVVVHRAEGYWGSGNPYGCLHTAKLADGTPLDQALEKARLGGETAIKNMEYSINVGGKRYVATNERFTSARLLPKGNGSGGSGKVIWELSVQKGSKGVFLDGNNFDGSLSSECEVLLQKDSKFEITGIKWDSSINKWRVKAKVVN